MYLFLNYISGVNIYGDEGLQSFPIKGTVHEKKLVNLDYRVVNNDRVTKLKVFS